MRTISNHNLRYRCVYIESGSYFLHQSLEESNGNITLWEPIIIYVREYEKEVFGR